MFCQFIVCYHIRQCKSAYNVLSLWLVQPLPRLLQNGLALNSNETVDTTMGPNPIMFEEQKGKNG